MHLFELIIMVVALSTIGSIVKSILSYRVRRMPAADQEAFRRIEEGMLEIREQVAGLREDVDELQERVDFTERMLARSREGDLRLGAAQAMRGDEAR